MSTKLGPLTYTYDVQVPGYPTREVSVVADTHQESKPLARAAYVAAVGAPADIDGITLAIVSTTEAPAAGYRTVRTPLGIGRIYRDQPGCTYYANDRGDFVVQVWDGEGDR